MVLPHETRMIKNSSSSFVCDFAAAARIPRGSSCLPWRLVSVFGLDG